MCIDIDQYFTLLIKLVQSGELSQTVQCFESKLDEGGHFLPYCLNQPLRGEDFFMVWKL